MRFLFRSSFVVGLSGLAIAASSAFASVEPCELSLLKDEAVYLQLLQRAHERGVLDLAAAASVVASTSPLNPLAHLVRSAENSALIDGFTQLQSRLNSKSWAHIARSTGQWLAREGRGKINRESTLDQTETVMSFQPYLSIAASGLKPEVFIHDNEAGEAILYFVTIENKLGRGIPGSPKREYPVLYAHNLTTGVQRHFMLPDGAHEYPFQWAVLPGNRPVIFVIAKPQAQMFHLGKEFGGKASLGWTLNGISSPSLMKPIYLPDGRLVMATVNYGSGENVLSLNLFTPGSDQPEKIFDQRFSKNDQKVALAFDPNREKLLVGTRSISAIEVLALEVRQRTVVPEKSIYLHVGTSNIKALDWHLNSEQETYLRASLNTQTLTFKPFESTEPLENLSFSETEVTWVKTGGKSKLAYISGGAIVLAEPGDPNRRTVGEQDRSTPYPVSLGPVISGPHGTAYLTAYNFPEDQQISVLEARAHAQPILTLRPPQTSPLMQVFPNLRDGPVFVVPIPNSRVEIFRYLTKRSK